MIITCNNCFKKFDLESSLISEKGRLLQCNGCDHKWFFKKEITKEPSPVVKNDINTEVIDSPNKKIISSKIEDEEHSEHIDIQIKKKSINKKVSTKKSDLKDHDKNFNTTQSKIKKKYNILGFTIVFITSFIALIILLDTFQAPIGKFLPDIEFILYNLYETINDIVLFLKDLI